MRLAIKLAPVELVAHVIRVRWPMTMDEARAQNRQGWTLAHYAEENGKVFSSSDAVYSESSLRQAYDLAQQWVGSLNPHP